MTTQKVAWPMMIVQMPEREVGRAERAVQRHAGDDAGQGDGQEQQEGDRLAPEEAVAMHGEGGAAYPRTRAMAVAPSPARTDVQSASRTPVCSNARSNHCRLNPGSGQAWFVLELKA